MRILPLIVLLACVAWQATAQEEADARPAGPRSLLKRGPLGARGKATTSTTTAAPAQEEEEYEDEEYSEGEPQEASTVPPSSSTTEGKKLIAGGVRPFRSNTDLLETLKRRRQEAAEAKQHAHTHPSSPSPVVQEVATESPAKANISKKRFSGKSDGDEVPSSKPSRSRFGKSVSARSVQPEQEEIDTAPVSSSRGSRFSRRGTN